VPFRHPLEGRTTPFADKKEAYSWAKAPRYDGKTVEVGPLARMMIAQDPLLLDLVREIGVNSLTRMLARQQEMIRLTRQISIWLENIKPNEPFYGKPSTWYRPQGIGLTESARGSLGHWMKTSSNLIESYQVITPSAWNMSPKDNDETPGPLEEALIGVTVKNRDNPVELNHIIRSFDPCMSCTVH
jgi:hydrogenase large subunit